MCQCAGVFRGEWVWRGNVGVESCAARPPSLAPAGPQNWTPSLKKPGTSGTNVVFPLQIKDLARAGRAKNPAQAPHKPSISGTSSQKRLV